MQNKFVSITAKKDKSTIYLIENVISGTAKDTAYDKVKRLIMNKPITCEKRAS